MNKIKIGWGESDITPNEPIALGGQFYERVSDSVDTPIKCTAFALECGNEQMIICSCDVASLSEEIIEKAKEKISDRIDIPRNKIIYSAIHTHSSYAIPGKSALDYLKTAIPEDMPYVSLSTGKESMDPNKAVDIITTGMANAVVDAWNNRKAGYYQNAFGRVAVGMCRRACYDDGSAKMWGETNLANFVALEGGNDSGMELIYTFDENKELSGVIANIACPAQVAEHRDYISSDYWGRVKINLEKKFGKKIFVLGLCSAAGDQCPRDLIRWVDPETPVKDPNIKHFYPIERRADPSMFDKSGLDLVGKRISNEIISVYEELPDEKLDESVLVHKVERVIQPLRRVTIAEYEEAVEKIDAFVEKNRGKSINYEDKARLHVYAGTVNRYILQQTMENYDIEVHFVRFGDVAIATNPYELFLDYGNQIRARSHAKQTFLIQLACGSFGYLPTEKAEQGSHYSAYVSSGKTGHVGGEILVRETLRQINEMFMEEQ